MRTNLINTAAHIAPIVTPSNSGKLDMDIKRSDKETGERLVNINTIEKLIYNGIQYVVK